MRRLSYGWLAPMLVLAACGGTNNPGDGTAGDVRGDVRGDGGGTDVVGTDVQGSDVQGADVQGTDVQMDDVQGTDVQGTDVQPGDTGGETGADISCGTGLSLCGASCVNFLTDTANCGACGNACAAGTACTAGSCARPCMAPMMTCGTSCVDLQTDNANCGACGTACTAMQTCTTGMCRTTTTCVAPLILCGTSCVDPNTDMANCGACGTVCAAGRTCVTGVCRIVCPAGQTLCGTTCVDVQTDNSNCGTCGTVCTGTNICRAGACTPTCAAPNTMCGAVCTNTATDVANCGACANMCTAANATSNCAGGMCGIASCTAGFGNCNGTVADGCETDLRTNSANCGACGTACGGGATCAASVCTCPAATPTMCGTPPVCRNLQTDNNNCGTCGTVCAAGRTCTAGVCTLVVMVPPNNECATAIAITLGAAGTTTTTMGTTLGATASAASCTAGSNDIYYSFTLPARAVVYADTFGSAYDTRIGFHDACGSAALACNDDACGGLQSQTVQVLNAGTHIVEVGGFGAATGAFTLRLQWFPVGTGAGSRIMPTAVTQTVVGATAGAGTLSGSCAAGAAPENSHFFTTCPANPAQTLHASTCPSAGGAAAYDSVIYQRSAGRAGDVCNDDSGAACGTRSSTTSAIPAGAGLHVITVDGFAGALGAYTLAYRFGGCLGTPAWTTCTGVCTETQTHTQNCGACGAICATASACVAGICGAPPNDNCGTPTVIALGASGTVTTVTGANRGATNSANSCGAGVDQFFQITLAATELVYIDTFGSTYDTIVGFNSSPACSAITPVCQDDACGTLQSQTSAILPAGSHRIVVDTFGAAVGTFTLRIQHVPVATGSVVSGGVPMGAYSIMANTTGAPSATHLCGGAGPERNYVWATCPAAVAGNMTASTCGAASYDTVLQIRNGNAAPTTCNDDAGAAMCPAGGLRSIINPPFPIPAGAGIHVLTVTGFAGQAGTSTVAGNRP